MDNTTTSTSGKLALDLPRRFDPIQVGHRDIHNNDIGTSSIASFTAW
jgi:hypothetical protein